MGLAQTVLTKLLDRRDGVTHEFLATAERSKFSEHLPWIAYDPESNVYLNDDDTAGFVWECAPVCFAGGKSIASLDGLFRLSFPPGTIVQVILHGDRFIEPFVEGYKKLKVRENQVVRSAVDSFSRFLLAGADGLSNLGGIPLRNFRLVVAVKTPMDKKAPPNMVDIAENVTEILKGAGLAPEPMAPPRLLAWMRRLFNKSFSLEVSEAYDDRLPVRDQVILAESETHAGFGEMKVGGKTFRCLTPKTFPKSVDPFQTNQLFGGVWGGQSDSDQAKTEFLYSLNILFDDKLKTAIHTKCNLVLQQHGVGSFAPSLARKKEEYTWAVDELEKGTRFVRVLPTLWVFGENEKTVGESLTRARRVWEAQGYVMQEDKGVLPILFIASLPFGLYDRGKTVETLDRDFITPAQAVTPLIPIQGDFSGGGAPVTLFMGRKGQLSTMDLFAKNAINHNCYVAASSGSGKSFFVNYLAFNYFAAGSFIRIIDIGGSYKKMARMFDGVYLEFTEESNICLNPFTNVVEIEHDLSAIASVVLQMIYSATDHVPVETAESAHTLAFGAVRWAYGKKGTDANIDDVYDYLNMFPNYASKEDKEAGKLESLKELSRLLAFNLQKFTSRGAYGRWFNGKATLDIAHNPFVVLELEHLKPKKELFKVVTLQVINGVTQDLYLSDRSGQRLIIFDEAWQFLGEGGGFMMKVIEEGYRRARKYGGSFSIITQSILDMEMFGAVGKVINGNSAFKFFLESTDFEKARDAKLISYEGFTMDLLRSVHSSRPKYSEMFVDTPAGIGVVRLAVDPVSYYVYTSAANEIAEIESFVAAGKTYDEAIHEMVRKYRSNN